MNPYINRDPKLPSRETDTETRKPAKMGPTLFDALPPRFESPFMLARCDVGTVWFVMTEMLVKKTNEKMRYTAAVLPKKMIVLQLSVPASAPLLSSSENGTKKKDGAANMLPNRTDPSSPHRS